MLLVLLRKYSTGNNENSVPCGHHFGSSFHSFCQETDKGEWESWRTIKQMESGRKHLDVQGCKDDVMPIGRMDPFGRVRYCLRFL